MLEASRLAVSPDGIKGGVITSPIRQILIVPQETLEFFRLPPGALRENVVIDGGDVFGDLHALPSGTVIQLGAIKVRLTIHCEPCPRIAHLVKPISAIKERRGYLGAVLNSGWLKSGDPLRLLGAQFEPIPFDIKARARWYLGKQAKPVPVMTFIRDMGLPRSYCRAVPALLRPIPGGPSMVVFGSDDRGAKT